MSNNIICVNKATEYLGLADIGYLSSRLLILSGIPTIGLAKAAEAIEKQFKLFFMLYEKITNNNELTVKDMKKRGHNLTEMLHSFNAIENNSLKLDETWLKLLTVLQEAYDKRYPEHWEEWKVEVSIDKIDVAYSFLRNMNAENLPDEYKNRAKDFGTFIGDIFRAKEVGERIRGLGLKTPMEILKLNNSSLEKMNLNEG